MSFSTRSGAALELWESLDEKSELVAPMVK